MVQSVLKGFCYSFLLFSLTSFAATQSKNIEINGVTTIKVPHGLQKARSKDDLSSQPWSTYEVEKVTLSPQMQNYINTHAIIDKKTNNLHLQAFDNAAAGNLPKKVDLGMNHVPVFDQGQHDTSSTFAVTAALDAGYGHGDYISQLCNLQLGQYLQLKDSSYESGWNGSSNQRVLDQIQKYGIISTSYQKDAGCGGLREYPTSSSRIGYPMSDDQFLNHHEDIMKILSFKKIYDVNDNLFQKPDPLQFLVDVKSQLAQGHRLTIQFVIDTKNGWSGAHGTRNYWHDTWVLTEEVLNEMFEGNTGLQSAVIIGYDDEATATSGIFNEAKGLLILRNSWGDWSGDNGNYYMSYNYLKMLVAQGHVVISPIDLRIDG